MSNIAGKAYAMNLVTPVYVKTAWLNILIVPGLVLLLKAIFFFIFFDIFTLEYCNSIVGSELPIIPWWVGGLLSVATIVFIVLGLARWIGLVNWLNEYYFWLLGLVSLVAAFLSTLNEWVAVLYGLGGLMLFLLGQILMRDGVVWLNRLIFWIAGLKIFQAQAFGGLITLSLIHYARWVILKNSDFPHLSPEQPKEKLKYGYMFFFSNFNGSWAQYVDSFSVAIPSGLNLLWNRNVGWKNAKVETPFNNYVLRNQIATEHYYNAYPLASSNDVKSAKRVRSAVLNLADLMEKSPDEFKKAFDRTTLDLQADLSQMEPTPIVSLANDAIERRESIQAKKYYPK